METCAPWIGCAGTVPWPARSPDLSLSSTFLCLGNYETGNLLNPHKLGRRTDQKVHDKLSLKMTFRAMKKRKKTCIKNGGQQLENNL